MRSIQENTNLEHVENKDQKGKVYSEVIVKDKCIMNEEMQISTEEANSKEKQHDLKTKVTYKHGNFALNEKAAIQKRLNHVKINH